MSSAEVEPPGKAYHAPGVTVFFDGQRCRHFAECVHGLPTVFDVQKRPWIQADAADPDLVAEVVRRCPSGALHYVLAEGERESGPVPTTVVPTTAGPLLLHGQLQVRLTADDARVVDETRMAACACGRTANGPFCDGACQATT